MKEVYPIIQYPHLSGSELVCKTLNEEVTDMLIDKWLEHRHDAYSEWLERVRERRHVSQCPKGQLLAWNKGEFIPENFFTRTVDTGRVIPLDRTWNTHVYCHRSMHDKKMSMLPVVYTILPELMLLRGMHDLGCDDIYIVVTDLTRPEMDDITEYFKLVCRANGGKTCKPSLEKRIRREHMRISQSLGAQRRQPCFPQIDMTFRGILNEKKPPFLVLFSHQATSYTQIFFSHPSFVPSEAIYNDFPTGCPNKCCGEDCEMVRFPRGGPEKAAVLPLRSFRTVECKEYCNWLDCGVCFTPPLAENAGNGVEKMPSPLTCSKCRLVSYCSADHQRRDWEEHRRVCIKI